MKTLLWIGGPLIAVIGVGLYIDVFTFGDQHPGMIHFSGVPLGGTFSVLQKDTYLCDENNNCTLVDSTTESEFSEVEGLEMEVETIEYRDGTSKEHSAIKQPGIPKYTNIHIKIPSGFDFKSRKLMFDQKAAIEEVEQEFEEKVQETR